MTRHYLSDDDVNYQRKINRAVVETIHPAPVVNRRRTLGGGGIASTAKIMFRCVYSNTDGENNEGNYIHVYDETYDGVLNGHKRAGLARVSSVSRGEWVNETWLEIPDDLEIGYVYLNRIYTFSPAGYKFELKLEPGEYVYQNPDFRQSTMLATVTRIEPEGEEETAPSWNVEQALFREETPVLFDSVSFGSGEFYPELSDLYITDDDPDYSWLKVNIRATTQTLKPSYQVGGDYIPIHFRNPDQDLSAGVSFEVGADGKIPPKTVVYWSDDRYQVSGELANGIISYGQANFRGRNYAAGASIYWPYVSDPQHYLYQIGRPHWDWQEFPIYSQFQVDFVISRTRTDPSGSSTALTVIDTATGIRIFNPADPNSQYAGSVTYPNWQAPAAVLPLTEGVLYLTCTWDAENSAPVFAYTFDISQLDYSTTWTKTLARIFHEGGPSGPWYILQDGDRNFNIYGRWV